MWETWVGLHGMTDLRALSQPSLIASYAGALVFALALPLRTLLTVFFACSVLHIAQDGWWLGLTPVAAYIAWSVGARHRAEILMLAFMALVHAPLHYARVGTSKIFVLAAMLLCIAVGPQTSAMLRYLYNSGRDLRTCQRLLLAIVTGHCVFHLAF